MPEGNNKERQGGVEGICIFVSSSDNTRDIFTQVFRAFARNWQGCTLPRFVGLNSEHPELETHGFQPVYAPVAGWRRELLQQIVALPPSFSHVLLFLDDFFLLSEVELPRLEGLLAQGVREDLPYLRLRRVRRPLIPAALHWLGRRLKPRQVEAIPSCYPYYSSLQVVLWKRSHLVWMLESYQGGIWDFEEQKPSARHYAVTGEPPIRYLHLVEKGKWQPEAEELFERAGLSFTPGRRPCRESRSPWRSWCNDVKFMIFGFSFLRIRRALSISAR